jgi:hypothetical protein
MPIGRYCLYLSLFLAALLITAVPIQASTVTYTDPGAWAGNTSDTTTIDFSGLASPNGFADYSNSTGLQIDDVQFIGQSTDTTYLLKVMDQNYAAPWYDWGAPATLMGPVYNVQNPTFVPYIHVILPSNATAFAVDLMTAGVPGLNYKVTLSDGENFTVDTYTRPTQAFFGLTADSPITFVDFTVLGKDANGLMANFQFGKTQCTDGGGGDTGQVPEAGTLILIGTGLVGLRGLKKFLPGHWA